MAQHLLSLVTFLPLVGALVMLLLIKGDDQDKRSVAAARFVALGVSVATFGLSLLLIYGFERADTAYQFVEKAAWAPGFNLFYHLGIDGIALWFVMLTTLLCPLCVLAAWSVTKRIKGFMMALLVLETMMIGTFAAMDIVLFYVFFEGVLIPMFFIIGIWGGEGRVYAAYKFFLYTFLGSVLMLVAVFAMIKITGTTDMTQMMGNKFPKDVSLWLWLAFFASFAVKTPMWPFHTWLPFAHVEAPTAGSALLAGVLLKMGGYGFIRISLQMLPDASLYFQPLMLTLSVIAIIYASLVALAQTDLKKLIAYSSVAHMGYVTLGLFSFNQVAIDGAIFVMLSHGIVSAALFLCVGVVYDRLHTREIKKFGGMASVTPHYAAFFMVFMLAAIGLPGTSGFVGEFLALQGAFQTNNLAAVLATFGMILGAAYMLWLYRRMFFGVAVQPDVLIMTDMNWREGIILAPLLLLVVVIGIQPVCLSSFFGPTTQNLAAGLKAVVGGHL